MTKLRPKDIADLASNVRCITFFGRQSVPAFVIDRYFHQYLKIDILYTNQDDFDSCLTVNPKTHLPEIILSNQYEVNAQLYLLIYSLGFLILAWHWTLNKKLSGKKYHIKFTKIFKRSGDGGLKIRHDGLLNVFVCEFLAPLHFIRNLYQQADDKDLSIFAYTVSDKCNVSLNFARYRLYNLKQNGLI